GQCSGMVVRGVELWRANHSVWSSPDAMVRDMRISKARSPRWTDFTRDEGRREKRGALLGCGLDGSGERERAASGEGELGEFSQTGCREQLLHGPFRLEGHSSGS